MTGLRPGVARVFASGGGSRDSIDLVVESRPGGYTPEAVDYFAEIALGFEYGDASRIVRRWSRDIEYQIRGFPTEEDLRVLQEVIDEINGLTVLHDIVPENGSPDLGIFFVPVDRFSEIRSNVVPGNLGFFSVAISAAEEIDQGVVLVGSDIDQSVRSHLIREEVTQVLGLGQDSFTYPESVFYQRWSVTEDYAPIDRELIEMLYRPEVEIGMDQTRVQRVLRTLRRIEAEPGAVGLPPATLRSPELQRATRRPARGPRRWFGGG